MMLMRPMPRSALTSSTLIFGTSGMMAYTLSRTSHALLASSHPALALWFLITSPIVSMGPWRRNGRAIFPTTSRLASPTACVRFCIESSSILRPVLMSWYAWVYEDMYCRAVVSGAIMPSTSFSSWFSRSSPLLPWKTCGRMVTSHALASLRRAMSPVSFCISAVLVASTLFRSSSTFPTAATWRSTSCAACCASLRLSSDLPMALNMNLPGTHLSSISFSASADVFACDFSSVCSFSFSVLMRDFSPSI
mmetsp:Transcript_4274/g.12308  ORF Transcript_4274/g.12308 Transcript_4274/m.12308 type:complete len:250 (-) Transcript_4274:750-1499(-)